MSTFRGSVCQWTNILNDLCMMLQNHAQAKYKIDQ